MYKSANTSSKCRWHPAAGVSLFELVLVIVVLGLLGALVAPITSQFIRGSQNQRVRASLITEGNIALGKMQQHIINIADNTDSNFDPQTNSLSAPTEDKVYDYQINNGDLEQTVDSTTSVLSPNATSLTFNYYDNNGNTTSTNSDIVYIEITLTLAKDNEQQTLRRLIFLRNPAYD